MTGQYEIRDLGGYDGHNTRELINSNQKQLAHMIFYDNGRADIYFNSHSLVGKSAFDESYTEARIKDAAPYMLRKAKGRPIGERKELARAIVNARAEFENGWAKFTVTLDSKFAP